MTEYIVFGICLIGCGWSCYHEGVKQGTEATINILHDKKIIAYSEKGDIIPNPLFKDYK